MKDHKCQPICNLWTFCLCQILRDVWNVTYPIRYVVIETCEITYFTDQMQVWIVVRFLNIYSLKNTFWIESLIQLPKIYFHSLCLRFPTVHVSSVRDSGFKLYPYHPLCVIMWIVSTVYATSTWAWGTSFYAANNCLCLV